VNELLLRELPLLARRGGCGKKKYREASTVPQTGWWFNKFLSNLDHHPVCAFAFGYRRIHPSWPGGAIRAYQQWVHTFYRPHLQPDFSNPRPQGSGVQVK